MPGWLVGLVLPLAWSGPAEEAEEVIVYGDDFARWDDTRWLVQAEFVFPMGLTLSKNQNEGFLTFALQLRGILACQKDHSAGQEEDGGRLRD